jgi:hypothetical protein
MVCIKKKTTNKQKNPEKDPSKIAKIGMREKNCIIKELSISIINISNKPCNFRNTDY